jgi:hypothetical protein
MSKSRSFRLFVPFLVAGFYVAAYPARMHSQPPKPPKDRVYSVTYHVGDMLGRPGGQTGYDKIDDIVKIIQTSVNPKSWHAKDGTSTIEEVNGTRLEIITTKAQHGEIADLLEALRRHNDVAVDLHADLCEVERTYFDREIKPKLSKEPQGPSKLVLKRGAEGLGKEFNKEATLVKTSVVRLANGKTGSYFSLRKAVTYVSKVTGDERKPEKTYETAFHGITLQASVAVTPDRRGIRLKLTQNVTALVEIRPHTVRDLETGKEHTIEEPNLVDSSTSAVIDADDGECLLLQVEAPAPFVKKDKVLVIVLTPRIFIAEEEKERKNNSGN